MIVQVFLDRLIASIFHHTPYYLIKTIPHSSSQKVLFGMCIFKTLASIEIIFEWLIENSLMGSDFGPHFPRLDMIEQTSIYSVILT